MKIIHVIDSLHPDVGGPANVAPKVAATQATLGHDVTILSNEAKSSHSAIKRHLAQVPHIEKVKIVTISGSRIIERFLPLRSWLWLRKNVSEETAVHIHGMWEPVLWIAAAVARRKNAVYVPRPCSMLHPWQMKRYPRIKKIVFAMGASSMLKKASFIQALNEDEALFVKKYIGNSPIKIIPNGIFPEQLPAAPLPHPFPELTEQRYILFLARLHYQKGITYLAKAFARVSEQINDVYLVIVGPDGGDKKNAIDIFEKAGLSEKVIFTGPVYGEEKQKYLSNAYCFCQPSLNEGFSNSIVEALAYGLPVITTKHAFFPEIEKSGSGYLTELNENEIADKLICIFRDPKKRNTMSENAKNLIRSNYTWEIIAKELIKAYEDATNSGKKS